MKRRSAFARIAWDAGMPDETIVGAVERLTPTPASHKHSRQKVTRWRRPVTPLEGVTDWKARQAAHYASRAALADGHWLGVSREPGWNDPAAAGLAAADLEALAVQLTLQATAVRACKAASLLMVPIPIDLGAYYSLIDSKVVALRELAAEARRKQAQQRRSGALDGLEGLTTAQYGTLSSAQRRQVEADLGLDLPSEKPATSDALGRFLIPYIEP